MRLPSTFFRISVICAIILAFALAGLASARVKASPPAQSTTAPTTAPTTASSAGTPGGTVPASTTAATAPAITTLGGDEAYPPCPQPVVATAPASIVSTAAATSSAGGAPTAVATSGSASATQVATTSASAAASAPASTPVATQAAAVAAAPAATTEPIGPYTAITGCTLVAQLSGANEEPKPGDPNGKGSAILTIARPASGPGEICFQIDVSGIKLPATAAHIHEGPAGIAGPVTVGLSAPDVSGKAQGCVNGVNRSTIKALLTYPQNFYVNVHNADFPDGSDRGQLAASRQ